MAVYICARAAFVTACSHCRKTQLLVLMSALGGEESELASEHEKRIKEAVLKAIKRVSVERVWMQSKSEPAFLRRLFVLEVHIERESQASIDKHREKIETLEAEVSKCQGVVDDGDKQKRANKEEHKNYTFGDRPKLIINLKKAENNLRVCRGLVTEYYDNDASKYYHYLYLIQLDEEGKPVLVARIDSETQKWKNLYDYHVDGLEAEEGAPEKFFLVDETTPATSIFSDKKDYFFKIFNKIEEGKASDKRQTHKGKTSFLYTYHVTSTNQGKFFVQLYGYFPHIWVGTNLAKIEILKYEIQQDAYRIGYLEGRINQLGQSGEDIKGQLKKLKGNEKYFKWWLNILLEAEKLNDHSACIEMARKHLEDIKFSEPIVLEIASDVSHPYWKDVILKKKTDISEASNRGDGVSEYMFLSHLETFNGYRLSKTNHDNSTIYDLFILQVINRKITILAKLTRKETFELFKLPMSHRWVNLPIKRTTLDANPNIRKVLEKYQSFFGKKIKVGADWQLDYSFTIARTESDEVGLLHGKTAYLPQLFIQRQISRPPVITTPLVRDSAYNLLKRGMQNPQVMLNYILNAQRDDDTYLTTYINKMWGFHHPGGPIMLQKKFDIDSAIRSLETKITQFEESKGRVSTGDDFSAAALQKTMARWRWW